MIRKTVVFLFLLPFILSTVVFAQEDRQTTRTNIYVSLGFSLSEDRDRMYLNFGTDAHLPLSDWLFLAPEFGVQYGKFKDSPGSREIGYNFQLGLTANYHFGASNRWSWKHEQVHYFVGAGILSVFDVDPGQYDTVFWGKIQTGFIKGKLKIAGFLDVPFEKYYEYGLYFGLIFSYRILWW